MSYTLELVDPASLLVDTNVRTAAELTPAFVANVRANGVLQAITAHRGEDGTLHVLYGQRRTLAAVEAGLDSVPVYVVDTPEEADRLATQVAENDQRRALTDADRAEAFHQMSLLGVSAAQIAKKAGAEKDTVERAIKARKNTAATAALDAGRTLDQALLLAEFEGESDALAELESVIADEPEMLEHVAQRLRNARAIAARIAEAQAQAEQEGLSMVEQIGCYATDEAIHLRYLVDAEGNQPAEDAANAVSLHLYHADGEVQRSTGIVGWKELGYRYRSPYGETRPSGPMSEEEKAERRTLIARNRAMEAATTVRREFVKALLARKAAPKGWQRFLAAAHTEHHLMGSETDTQLAAGFLGCEPKGWAMDALAQHVATHPGRPDAALLALVFSGFEKHMPKDCWRRPSTGLRFYLTQLADWGYTVSETERLITDDPAAEANDTDSSGDADIVDDADEPDDAA